MNRTAIGFQRLGLTALITACLLAADHRPAFAQDAPPLQTPGRVDAVTVYRGQALVTRIIEIDGPAGLRELVVTDLPDQVIPGSLHAEGGFGLNVRSVLYRERPVQQDIREEVREIDEQIKALHDRIRAAENLQNLNKQQLAYLDKLEQFTAVTANTELTRGVLDAQTLQELTRFSFEQRRALTRETFERAEEIRGWNEQVSHLQRQRQSMASRSSHLAREAEVLVEAPAEGGEVRLRYLVNRAGWAPSYNVRAEADRDGVVVEYMANIQQTTGEHWRDVRMTLSTATPSLIARAPRLNPLTVTLGTREMVSATVGNFADAAGASVNGDAYRQTMSRLLEQQQDNERKRANAPQAAGFGLDQRRSDRGEAEVFDANLNTLGSQRQILDVVAGKVQRDVVSPQEESFSVSYALAGRTSLPSRTDQQLMQIASMPMKGEFYRLAHPLLTSYVYEEALVTNTSDMVLLTGPVATYLNGQFVGHGHLNTVTTGQPFVVGFGIDSSLYASRELIDRSESVQGGNRVLELTYRLKVDNYGQHASTIRLMDRLPVAEDAQVRVTLLGDDAALSDDARYLQAERPKGILRWDVQVPAEASGTDAFTLDYRFRLEFDRQKHVVEKTN